MHCLSTASLRYFTQGKAAGVSAVQHVDQRCVFVLGLAKVSRVACRMGAHQHTAPVLPGAEHAAMLREYVTRALTLKAKGTDPTSYNK